MDYKNLKFCCGPSRAPNSSQPLNLLLFSPPRKNSNPIDQRDQAGNRSYPSWAGVGQHRRTLQGMARENLAGTESSADLKGVSP